MPFKTETARQDGPETGAGQSSRDNDVAIAMVGEQSNTIDPAIAARAVRKTDWFLIPAMIIGCMYPFVLPDRDPPLTLQTASSTTTRRSSAPPSSSA